MPNLEKRQSLPSLSSISRMGLINQLFEQTPDDYDAIELVVSLEQNGIKLKELSSYLDVIYGFDAHLSDIGFNSYIHQPDRQIQIDEIRFGSWEIVIQGYLHSIDADRLAIIYLGLKFLSKLVETLPNSVHRYYEILDKREDFLEKRDKRRRRKNIRELINQEFDFSNLERKQRERLVDVLEELYQKVDNKLVPASRLARRTIKDLKLNPVRKKNR